ncbi:hypothetical protein LMG7974_00154 [Campylobacter majalis]|uniref:Outer membrane lipoprotein carrier protein LolA n=1 Tax=Campylobacter majalis TaxID=2790656 RepID=A0ABM8Q256_9BACT|nr:outer membrane lipoprotein carrier protein LolA [Campylobacter majalis]CAD7286928.1 hypothetical protein LMG7974_00154 [Campylobacter majalis]
MRYNVLLLLFMIFGYCFDINELATSLKHDVVGDFNQTKNIVGFNRAIKSSGEFSLRNDEFVLNTLKPVKHSVKVSKDGIFNLKNNEWVKNERVGDMKLLLSLINLDINELSKEFELLLSGDERSWEVDLKPKGIVISKIFKNIQIYGSKYVQVIKLNEINGDETINEFSIR